MAEHDDPETLDQVPGDELETVDGPEIENDGEDEGDEFSILIDGDEPPADETPLVKDLRQQLRDRDRELSAYRKTEKPKIKVGEKPTLESCDYDTERYESEIFAWQERKRKADQDAEDEEKAQSVRNEESARRFNNYRSRLAAIPLSAEEKEAAEQQVVAALSPVLQSAIIAYSDDPAKVMLALAKNPRRLDELAKVGETDVGMFVKMLTKLEGNLKVVTRNKPPAPEAETVLRGSAPVTGGDPSKELAKLEKEAERTGDRTKVIAFKRAQKEKAK